MKTWLSLAFLVALPMSALADTITEYSIPTSAAGPAFIAQATDGSLWFTESSGNSIGKLVSETGTFTEFDLPNSSSTPWGIVKGPDGNMWFTERDGDRIGKITSDGTITEFDLTAGSEPYQIISDDENGVLWATLYGRNKIAKITTAGIVTEFSIPTTSSNPTGLTKLNDDIWFSEEAGNKIGRFRSNETFSEYPISTGGALPNQMFTDSRGTLWVTMSGISKIASIKSDGTITEYSTLTLAADPIAITEGPLGTPLWFTEGAVNKIGKVGINGYMVSETSLPTAASNPFALIAGNDNKLWGTEQDGNKIFRITPTDLLTITTSADLPDGAIGSPYSIALNATGGTPAYTYEVVPGDGFTLPDGFTLSPAGILSGTPTTSITSLIRVKITDAAGITIQKGFVLTVPESPLPDLKVKLSLKSQGTKKNSYRISITNQGIGTAQNFTLKAYSSSDKKISSKDSLLLNQTIGSLASNERNSQIVSVKRAFNTAKRYLLVCVNCQNDLSEETVQNNEASIAIQ